MKKFFWLALLGLSVQLSWGYALLGPNNEPYQVPDIGYNPLPPAFDMLSTGPKNLGEEYRRNTPVLYYSFDASWLDYFGASGVAAVDSAIQVLNGLTNVSQYSRDLSEFSPAVTRENYLAEALSLFDIKSFALHYMVEQLGLAEPERFVWTLHDRSGPAGGLTCPAGMSYTVIQRNFDPVPSPLNQFQSSSYVNGTLYTYFILEVCGSPPGPPLAEALEVQVDPLDTSFTAVAGKLDASGQGVNSGLLNVGKFYTGLTRDDVGGLRYLLRTNNVNWESTGVNTTAFVTNTTPQVLYTSNLTFLAQQALTNDAPTLQALFPGLTIVASSNYFVTVYITNVTAFFANYPWDPVGTPAHLAFTTNVVPTIQARYNHTFGNLLTLVNIPTPPYWALVPLATIPTVNGRAWITIQNLTVGTAANPWGPVGSTTITTNATLTTYLTNSVVGDYIILPPNLCSAAIIASQLTNVVSFTNIINSATNTTITSTNSTGGTNAGTLLSFEQDMITYFTNHAFIILPVTCPPANVSLYEGVERISFVRRDYDSLLGRFFSPITNTYVLNSITNSVLLPQTIQRTVTAPDFLFNAADMAGGPNDPVNTYAFVRPSINFNTANAIAGLAGPGTIEPSTTLTFNKVGPIYLNFSPNAYFISSAEANQFPFWIWGSFDGTTNAPVVYPNGTTIANMENQILMGIGPESLPAGQVGVPYDPGSPTFTGTGGQPPYTWSLSPTSPGLPPFVHLTPDGTLHPVDTPTGAATYDFTIRMTDAGARFVERAYSITINP